MALLDSLTLHSAIECLTVPKKISQQPLTKGPKRDSEVKRFWIPTFVGKDGGEVSKTQQIDFPDESRGPR